MSVLLRTDSSCQLRHGHGLGFGAMARSLRLPAHAIALALLCLSVGCGGEERIAPASGARALAGESSMAPQAAAAAPPKAALAAPAADDALLVAFLGDSLTAGFGLAEEQAFPAVTGELLAARGVAVRVVNGGVSGDTSSGALARVDWLLTQKPDVVVVAIGGNDGLRGQPVAALERNLREIVRRARAADARVLVAGQQIPTNYGPEYATAFRELYPRVAREEGAELLPFLLEGVAMIPRLNLPDGIHPNSAGQRVVAGHVADALEPMLRARSATRG